MIEISNEERQNNVTNANMLNSTMSIPEKLLAKSKGSYSFIVISGSETPRLKVLFLDTSKSKRLRIFSTA